ncbi:MAG: YbjQ family protein [Haloferacaceae archaeon]
MTAFGFEDENVMLTTAPSLPGHEITDHRGLVVADVTPGRNIGKDIAASLRDVVGGRSASWEATLEETQSTALQELVDEAAARGANAVVGIRLEDEAVGGSGGMMNVKATGTAVVVSE